MTEPEPQHGPIVRAVGPYVSYSPRPGTDYGMGRHIHHDPRSRAFRFQARATTLEPVRHLRQIPIFDQGNLGSCTGNAALGILGTEPYFSALKAAGLLLGDGVRIDDGRGHVDLSISFTEDGAVWLYSDITQNDPFPGGYPPTDTGSDGLSAAKVITGFKVIPSYQHTFSLDAALAALQEYPLLVGTDWTKGMFSPDEFGLIYPTGQVAGGHEWIVDEYVPPGRPFGPHRAQVGSALIGGTTSWGTDFGDGGRFYMSVKNFGALLKRDGDVIVMIPPTAPVPVPTPAPAPGTPSGADVARAVRDALAGLGL